MSVRRAASSPRRLRRAILVALALLVAPHGAAQDDASPAPDVDWPAFVQELMLDADLPGLACAAVRDGRIVFAEGYGIADHGSGTRADGESVHLAMSLGMPVFAYAVLRLAEREDFDLDAPLFPRHPEPRLAGTPGRDVITPRMLLANTSGLPNLGGDVLALQATPGAAARLSSEGYLWLQRAVEDHTGLDVDAFVRREVLAPLDMTSSAFIWHPFMQGRLVSGRSFYRKVRPVGRLAEGFAAGSLMTTARDYAKFLIEVMDGSLLSPARHAEFLAWQAPLVEPDVNIVGRRDLGAALGFVIQRTARGEQLVLWGDNGDFKAWTLVDVPRRRALVLFVNDADGLSIARALSEPWFGADQPALAWLDPEPHDDPDRILRRSLERTFRERGVEAGRRRFAEVGARFGPGQSAAQLRQLAYTLLLSEHHAEALAVGEILRAAHPGDPASHGVLADVHVRRRDWRRALDALDDLLAITPEDGRRRWQASWLREDVLAEESPPVVGADILAGCVGDYGARHVRLEDGALVYWRHGSERQHPLVPVTRDTFRTEGLDGFRLQFVFAPGGTRATHVRALHFDGSSELQPRNE